MMAPVACYVILYTGPPPLKALKCFYAKDAPPVTPWSIASYERHPAF